MLYVCRALWGKLDDPDNMVTCLLCMSGLLDMFALCLFACH